MGQARRKEKAKKEERQQEAPKGQPPEAPAESAAPPKEAPAPAAWVKPQGLSLKGWATLIGVILAIQFPLIHYALVRGEAKVTAQVPYSEDFSDPGVVARDFFSTG